MDLGSAQRWEIPCVERPSFYGDSVNIPFRFVPGWSIRWATINTIELVPEGGEEPSCRLKADADLNALAFWPEQHRVIARDQVGRVFFLEIG